MKNEEKIRMLLHPEQYSEEQLDQMLNETDIPVPDVDEEWQRFKEQRTPRRHRNPMMRWAAIFITVAALSGISYAAINHWRKSQAQKEEQKTEVQQENAIQEQKQETVADIATVPEQMDSVRQDHQFNNVELQQIMQQVAHDYDVTVVFANENARTIRFYLKWEAEETLQDIVNRINHFEKVHLTLSGNTITIN